MNIAVGIRIIGIGLVDSIIGGRYSLRVILAEPTISLGLSETGYL
jgi:hypothetical protein